jgi:hypothetical protein
VQLALKESKAYKERQAILALLELLELQVLKAHKV